MQCRIVDMTLNAPRIGKKKEFPPNQIKTLAPEMPAMFFSCAEDKALCMAIVPKDVVNGKSFKASDWCKEVQALIDGKVT